MCSGATFNSRATSKATTSQASRRQTLSVTAHCICMGREACSRGYTGSVFIIAGGKLQPLHQSGGEIFCWALHAGQPCTPPCINGGERGRAGEARLEFLSCDGMGGGVQACNRTQCLYDQLPVRRSQGAAMLNYRHTDSVLFGNGTCCTIKTFST